MDGLENFNRVSCNINLAALRFIHLFLLLLVSICCGWVLGDKLWLILMSYSSALQVIHLRLLNRHSTRRHLSLIGSVDRFVAHTRWRSLASIPVAHLDSGCSSRRGHRISVVIILISHRCGLSLIDCVVIRNRVYHSISRWNQVFARAGLFSIMTWLEQCLLLSILVGQLLRGVIISTEFVRCSRWLVWTDDDCDSSDPKKVVFLVISIRWSMTFSKWAHSSWNSDGVELDVCDLYRTKTLSEDAFNNRSFILVVKDELLPFFGLLCCSFLEPCIDYGSHLCCFKDSLSLLTRCKILAHSSTASTQRCVLLSVRLLRH